MPYATLQRALDPYPAPGAASLDAQQQQQQGKGAGQGQQGEESVRALEDLIIEAIYAGVLQGRLDQRGRLFHVTGQLGRDVRIAPSPLDSALSTAPRDEAPTAAADSSPGAAASHLPHLLAQLDAWHASSLRALELLQTCMADVERARAAREARGAEEARQTANALQRVAERLASEAHGHGHGHPHGQQVGLGQGQGQGHPGGSGGGAYQQQLQQQQQHGFPPSGAPRRVEGFAAPSGAGTSAGGLDGAEDMTDDFAGSSYGPGEADAASDGAGSGNARPRKK